MDGTGTYSIASASPLYRLRSAVQLISQGLDRVGQAALVLLLIAVLANIALRLLNIAAIGLFEAISFLGAAVFCLTCAFTQAQKSHLRIRSLVERLPGRTQLVVEIVVDVLSLVSCSVLLWANVLWVLELIERKQVFSVVVPVPTYPMALTIALAVAVLWLVFATDLIEALAKAVKK